MFAPRTQTTTGPKASVSLNLRQKINWGGRIQDVPLRIACLRLNAFSPKIRPSDYGSRARDASLPQGLLPIVPYILLPSVIVSCSALVDLDRCRPSPPEGGVTIRLQCQPR